MLARWLLSLLALLAFAAPARADDISAAGRGVVRVVTIAVVEDEVVGFGHGSGFAVAPNRIVTNAHVVEAAARYPGNVIIGIVPSEGDKSYQGRVVAVDPARDLALIELSGTRLAPLTLFTGPVNEGETVVALGYPGNVDLATARSAADYITPLQPIRSQGAAAGRRRLVGVEVLLHTASIARGNSGGPLLDRCGRVIGTNSALTRAEDGDASFGFAIAGRELAAFLREAEQPVTANGLPCVTIEERMASDRAADESDAARIRAEGEARAARALAVRQAALERARAENQRLRENIMALAAVLLVAGALALGGAGLLEARGRRREAIWALAGGGVLLLGAAVVFVTRPSAEIALPEPMAVPEAAPGQAATGPMTCTLIPERSRVTVSSTADVPLSWTPGGCVNGRTQYAAAGTHWQRILVPDEEATVSVLDYDPAARRYSNSRYLLSSEQMTELRRLREGVTVKSCGADPAARATLADQQQAIRQALPALPNERLVYQCAASRD
jgi:S1-C subfamily serine protease